MTRCISQLPSRTLVYAGENLALAVVKLSTKRKNQFYCSPVEKMVKGEYEWLQLILYEPFVYPYEFHS